MMYLVADNNFTLVSVLCVCWCYWWMCWEKGEYKLFSVSVKTYALLAGYYVCSLMLLVLCITLKSVRRNLPSVKRLLHF